MGCSGSKLGNNYDTKATVVKAKTTIIGSDLPPLDVADLPRVFRVPARRLVKGPIPKKDAFSHSFQAIDHPKLSWIENYELFSQKVSVVPPSMFLCFLQQKSRHPSRFFLYDVASRAKFCAGSMKYAICPWRTLAAAELRDETASAALSVRTAEQVANTIVLLFSREDELANDSNYELFMTKVLGPALSSTRAVYVLRGSMDDLIDQFPNVNSTTTIYFLPGPTEILFQRGSGFCLYLGDVRDVSGNLATCLDVFQVATFIQVDRDAAVPVLNAKRVKYVNYENQSFENRGAFYLRVVETIYKDASESGGPVFLFSNSNHAVAVTVWLLVEIGWSLLGAEKHVARLRGGDTETVLDQVLLGALKELDVRKSSNLAEARSKAVCVFPALNNDPIEL